VPREAEVNLLADDYAQNNADVDEGDDSD